MPYQPAIFSPDIYRELTRKLSDKEEEKLRREIHRLEQQQRNVNQRLWDDLVSQRVRLVFVTTSGKRFTLSGKNWPSGYQAEFDQPAELNDQVNDSE